MERDTAASPRSLLATAARRSYIHEEKRPHRDRLHHLRLQCRARRSRVRGVGLSQPNPLHHLQLRRLRGWRWPLLGGREHLPEQRHPHQRLHRPHVHPQGSSIFLLAGEVSYALPAPAGRWLPNARCEVYREACPTDSVGNPTNDCPNHRDDCALTDHKRLDTIEPSRDQKLAACGRHSSQEKQKACRRTVDDLWYCQNPTNVQPCNWEDDSSLLGKSLYQLPLLPVDEDFPFACAAGLLGSADPEYQSSSSCAGRCRARSQCPTEATSQALPCTVGQYCPKGTSVPLPCPAGSHSNATDLAAASECTACPAGSACSTGSVDPTPCSPGTFAAKEGQPNCTPCPPGTSSGQGSDACDACEAGRYAANAGQGLCVPCPHPLSSVSGSVTCSFCMDGYYLRNTSADPDDIFTSPTEYCKPCAPNAVCPDNTTLSSLVLPRGFWRASPSSAVLTECRLFGGNDNAGKTRCAGSEPVAGEASRRRRMEEAGSEYCASDFEGPECQLCAAENHYLVDGDECKECAARGAAAGSIAGIVLGLCVACGLAAWAYSMTDWRDKRYLGPILRFADRSVKYYVGGGMTAKVKILFGFYQISTVLSSTYSARLPREYTRWTDKLANAVSIDWSGFFLPEQCLGYGLRLLVIALSPVALIALLMGAGISQRLLHRWRAAPAPRERSWYAEAALGLLDLTPAGLVLVFCFVPSISASIFRAWSCQAPPADDCRCSRHPSDPTPQATCC